VTQPSATHEEEPLAKFYPGVCDFETTLESCQPHRTFFPKGCQWREIFPRGAFVGLVHIGKTAGTSVRRRLAESNIMALNETAEVPRFVLNYSSMHMLAHKPPYGGLHFPHWDLLVISVRDPMARAVSAFNMETGLTSEAHDVRRALKRCFPLPFGMDRFSRALNDYSSTCGMLARRCLLDAYAYKGEQAPAPGFWNSPRDPTACGHLNTGMDHYLAHDRGNATSILNRLRMNLARAYLVHSEDVEADTAGMLDWLCLPHLDTPVEHDDHGDTIEKGRHEDTSISPEGRIALRSALSTEYHHLETLEMLADNGANIDYAWTQNFERVGDQMLAFTPFGIKPFDNDDGAESQEP
jgi:hypothetical protein